MKTENDYCVPPAQAKNFDRDLSRISKVLAIGLAVSGGLYALDASMTLALSALVITWVVFGFMMARCKACRHGVCELPDHQKP